MVLSMPRNWKKTPTLVDEYMETRVMEYLKTRPKQDEIFHLKRNIYLNVDIISVAYLVFRNYFP